MKDSGSEDGDDGMIKDAVGEDDNNGGRNSGRYSEGTYL
jgi:hypothetical protein